MLTKFYGKDRPNWSLPCFARVNDVYLSDSQFRDIELDDTRRSEHVVVLRGCSGPDMLNLLTLGFVTATGCECF